MNETVFNHPLVASAIAGFLLLGIIGKLLKFSFERLAKWYLYVSVFSVVVVMNSEFFPFIGGKDYFFRFAVELALISVLLWWAFEAPKGELERRLKAIFKKPLAIAVSAFAGIFLLASFFAYDFHAAFWSNYERGEGAFQMLHYLVFFLLLGLLFRDDKDWKNIFRCSLVAGGLMILYGIGGNFSLSGFIGPYAGTTPPSGFFHTLIDGRFQGSLGNPAYVAPYLLFAMFYAGYLWADSRRSGKKHQLVSWGYGAIIAIALFFFILSQTRGAFLGLGASILALLVYLAFVARGNLRKWSAIALGIFVVLGIGLYAIRNNPTVKNLPEGRLLEISLSDATAQTRIWVWGEAWKGFLERPILGWGPENFTPVFDKYFDPRFYVPNQQTETWYDRAHSVFFDYLVETGILGLLSYLGMFFMLAWGLMKKDRVEGNDHESRKGPRVMQRGLMVAIPVAYLVQGIAIFDVLPMYINLFLFLAFSTYYLYKKD